MKKILIILLLIITFSWLPIPEITQVASANIIDGFSGGSGYPNPPDQPSKQRPGGGRGICPSSSNDDNTKNEALTSLVPIRQKLAEEANSTWSKIPPTLTTSKNPTFWFYVPEPETSGKKAEFMLLYQNDTYAIKEPISAPLSGTPGFFTFPPKDKDIALNDGIYHWFFTIICDVKQPARNQNVEGWIEKITVSQELSSELLAASETRKIELYFKHKIWHEFVSLLAQGHRDRPNDKITLDREYTIEEAWQQILKEVGLNKDS